MGAVALTHPAPYGLQDLFGMPADGNRYEVLDGQPIVSPAPSARHQWVAYRLATLLNAAAPPGVHAFTAVAVRCGEDSTGLIPDVVITTTPPRTTGLLLDPPEVLHARPDLKKVRKEFFESGDQLYDASRVELRLTEKWRQCHNSASTKQPASIAIVAVEPIKAGASSLREQFAIWYPLSAEERQRFIRDGLVVLDANVLLDLYRMTVEAREDVLALLRRLGDRLWIPHQVGLEFHRNRLSVIYDQEQTDQKLRTAIAEAKTKLHEAIKSIRDHPVIDRTALAAIVNEAFTCITSYLDKAGERPSLSTKAAIHADAVLDAITVLFQGKVGTPYPADKMTQVRAEAKRRVEQRHPPGYADAKKDADRASGDYVLWRQMLDEASKRRLPILFVTNDQKEDWYRRLHGLTIGPRVELVTEMAEEAGAAFHAQTLVRFVETAPTWLRSTVKETTVSEVNRLDEVDRASLRANLASKLAESEFERQTLQQSDTRQSGDRPTLEIIRLEARQRELAARVAELQSDLDASRGTEKSDGSAQSSDPRSYVRAVEARLGASSQMLDEVTEQLSTLRDGSVHRTNSG